MTKLVTTAILSFTEIDRDQHVLFNKWHRFDHQPERHLIEGVVTGTRFVAPSDLQARRFALDEALAATQYFGYYLISEPVVKTFEEISALAAKDKTRGRWYDRRGPSAPHQLVNMYASPHIVNHPAVIPFRTHQGVFVTVDDPKPGASVQDLKADLAIDEENTVRRILDIPGVAGCWSFEFTASSPVSGLQYKTPEGRITRIYWLEGQPSAFLDRLEAHTPVRRSGLETSYQAVFRGAYLVIPPDSTFDWFQS